ncbi:hypothetical protein MLD59_20570, partial [Verrucomicrobiaceae bacterium E54]|nr:hypothetical protein [Verrucomicrobiaceae bacterium E54]
ERVAERARPYYLKHLERWGAALRARPSETSKQDFLEGYFEKLIHTEGVQAFQARQVLEAIRLAHEVLLNEEWTSDLGRAGAGAWISEFQISDFRFFLWGESGVVGRAAPPAMN